MCQTKLPSSRTTSCKHSRKRYLQRLPSWTTSDPESRYLAESSTWILLSTSTITTRREQRSYWHLVTLTVLCVITVLAFIVYSLKPYTHKMFARCMTRQNTSSQNTTESNPVHETSCTNSDENAPDAKRDERHVFPVYPTLST